MLTLSTCTASGNALHLYQPCLSLSSQYQLSGSNTYIAFKQSKHAYNSFPTSQICLAAQKRSARLLTVISASAKTIKSPAEEEWKTKREFLLKKKYHPEGAINVQIYRLIKEWTAWDVARRVAFAFFGIFQGTEENPEFLEEVRSKLDKNSKIIVLCSQGGTMKPSANFPEGQQSRSLIAAYLLALDGYSPILHLEGGLYAWGKAGLPVSNEE
ncbi:rhodanese-like domain-containing protein 14, chloroplastic isoform X2 [Cryptomeria japonica]|uniref:rhodanese-like domain-containing protein 14, chloroplastic isoform X2 n=1 Tax=Cryptomeria japonica TaxID=3369 RepID=UPI0025AB8C5C|nr:rhodanese-like domain-containing protein 14, chloroplastic isoform X2 [Cryptomeria japonica]